MQLCFCLTVGLWCSKGPHSGYSWRGDLKLGSCFVWEVEGAGLRACADGDLVFAVHPTHAEPSRGVFCWGVRWMVQWSARTKRCKCRYTHHTHTLCTQRESVSYYDGENIDWEVAIAMC